MVLSPLYEVTHLILKISLWVGATISALQIKKLKYQNAQSHKKMQFHFFLILYFDEDRYVKEFISYGEENTCLQRSGKCFSGEMPCLVPCVVILQVDKRISTLIWRNYKQCGITGAQAMFEEKGLRAEVEIEFLVVRVWITQKFQNFLFGKNFGLKKLQTYKLLRFYLDLPIGNILSHLIYCCLLPSILYQSIY